MEEFDDISTDVNKMDGDQAALYEYSFDLYGRSDEDAVHFSGSVLKLFSLASYYVPFF